MTVLPGLARERPLDEERDLWRVLLVARGRRLEEERQPLAAQRLGRLAREQREHVIDRVGRRHFARVLWRGIYPRERCKTADAGGWLSS